MVGLEALLERLDDRSPEAPGTQASAEDVEGNLEADPRRAAAVAADEDPAEMAVDGLPQPGDLAVGEGVGVAGQLPAEQAESSACTWPGHVGVQAEVLLHNAPVQLSQPLIDLGVFDELFDPVSLFQQKYKLLTDVEVSFHLNAKEASPRPITERGPSMRTDGYGG